MKIDYAAIIENANVRKDALQKFERTCHNLQGQITASDQLLTALTEFKAAYEALDPEAIKLLPEGAGHAVFNWVGAVLIAWNSAHNMASYQKMTPSNGLAMLVESD